MVAREFTDRDADRMVTWFAWRRRLRNALAIVISAGALGALLAWLFQVEVPELNWAEKPTRALTHAPQAMQHDDVADASVPDVSSPTPTPPVREESAMLTNEFEE
jgi:hypothetical protein